MTIRFEALATETCDTIWQGGHDAYDMAPERRISDGNGVPCRHCLQLVASGAPYLVLAHRPFPALQPYAETGPIFLHAEACRRYEPDDSLPPILADSPDYILRGYGDDDRIVYGTGRVTPTPQIAARAADLLSRDDIAYVHIRSARNNCYQCRVVRD
ncbi:DUF1203 domain-containing protein [Martelella alba]|uniref:DUF1203 domain-containing protein n=1 Tax=Martelella alba TaxID=2590451 RepID=A0A506U9J0_9HYPH|nr:DUF1203 domain-containing protein [Martelella alba]TPW29761.1 DUF1203 domain-containing protein [Martelella alba]